MSFWETVAGHRLAEILCSTLPKLANKEQKTIRVTDKTEAQEKVEEMVKDRYRFISMIEAEDSILLIFEK
ncbi:MAG: hypothetical protein K6G00_00570 [Treponema sp.]|nr:hypothetical protein [Treponema sp.]